MSTKELPSCFISCPIRNGEGDNILTEVAKCPFRKLITYNIPEVIFVCDHPHAQSITSTSEFPSSEYETFCIAADKKRVSVYGLPSRLTFLATFQHTLARIF